MAKVVLVILVKLQVTANSSGKCQVTAFDYFC